MSVNVPPISTPIRNELIFAMTNFPFASSKTTTGL
jgi:hypothetical protein